MSSNVAEEDAAHVINKTASSITQEEHKEDQTNNRNTSSNGVEDGAHVINKIASSITPEKDKEDQTHNCNTDVPIQVESSSNNEVHCEYTLSTYDDKVAQNKTQSTDFKTDIKELIRDIEEKIKEYTRQTILNAIEEEKLRHQIIMRKLNMELKKIEV